MEENQVIEFPKEPKTHSTIQRNVTLALSRQSQNHFLSTHCRSSMIMKSSINWIQREVGGLVTKCDAGVHHISHAKSVAFANAKTKLEPIWSWCEMQFSNVCNEKEKTTDLINLVWNSCSLAKWRLRRQHHFGVRDVHGIIRRRRRRW